MAALHILSIYGHRRQPVQAYAFIFPFASVMINNYFQLIGNFIYEDVIAALLSRHSGVVSDAPSTWWHGCCSCGWRHWLAAVEMSVCIPSQETTIHGTSLISSTGAVTSRPPACRSGIGQTKLSVGDRRRVRLPLISNIWCTQMTSVIIWSRSSSTQNDAAAVHCIEVQRCLLWLSFSSSWPDWCKKQLKYTGVKRESKVEFDEKYVIEKKREHTTQDGKIYICLP